MSLFAHIEELTEKHKAIHREIELEMARPLVDGLESLRIETPQTPLKEKIEKLRGEK